LLKIKMKGKQTRSSNKYKIDWEWAKESTVQQINQEQVEKVYGVHFNSCSLTNDKTHSKSNCRSNPNCLVHLGEANWISNTEVESAVYTEVIENIVRQDNQFLGLRNLGATCYVNSLLQVWFFISDFRSAIYSYRNDFVRDKVIKVDLLTDKGFSLMGLDDNVDIESHYYEKINISKKISDSIKSSQAIHSSSQGRRSLLNNLYESVPEFVGNQEQILPALASICDYLQLIFAFLQFSKRRSLFTSYIDPSPLIKFLGLDTNQQQDIQEFCQLTMTLLETTLSSQLDTKVQSTIGTLFQGRYSYITKCDSCKFISERNATFYELDLTVAGHSTLEKSFDDFFKKEKLNGPNQYYCEVCQSKRDASRWIGVDSLPPVLNIQLLRFIYDRNTGQKKKLKSILHFPEVLDMTKYIRHAPTDTSFIYDIKAVLIHRGAGTQSGHYFTHIKEDESKSWYVFNDEAVYQLSGKKLQIDEDSMESDDLSQSSKNPKPVKAGYHASRSAYMLVYTRRSSIGEYSSDLKENVILPRSIVKIISEDNVSIKNWINAVTEQMLSHTAAIGNRAQEINRIYPSLSADTDQTYEWIPTEWLLEWLRKQDFNSPIDNKTVLCNHKKLSPDSVSMVKRINQIYANELYKLYGGGPRLTREDMCKQCVEEKYRRIQFDTRLNNDWKFIKSTITKTLPTGQTEFWIGKASLRNWKGLTIKKFEKDISESSLKTTTENSEPAKEDAESDANLAADSATYDDEFEFNQDLLCEEHGNLTAEESNRQIVSEVVWLMLKYYFPEAASYPVGTPICHLCEEIAKAKVEDEETLRLYAATEKKILSKIYSNKSRPSIEDEGEFYVIPLSFVRKWRNFIRQPIVKCRPKQINLSEILCEHNKLPFDPLMDLDGDKIYVNVTTEEWVNLLNFYGSTSGTCKEIKITVKDRLCECFPPCCQICIDSLIERRATEIKTYRNARIYISKENPDDEKCIGPSHDECENIQKESRKRSITTISPLRRSKRCRPGEVAVTISSDETLRDLKLKVMTEFQVAPFDQHLHLNGCELFDNDRTLGNSGILPDCRLTLKIDLPVEITEEPREPEAGFMGTGLVSFSS
ncbi:Ubiquitin carboxyl-terminal hydrolase 48, partial [Trichoplax sp. H2]